MRLPRRVSWSPDELERVCSLIYDDESNPTTRQLAIDRLSAWRTITPLPHALESTLSLLTVRAADEANSSPSTLSLRQSYASAVIRMVNGFVDPLQAGAFARSIASIASQLGLPLWLVELRHAATHEDLPSLELLREACRQTLGWLSHNFFMLEIHPSTDAANTLPPLRSVAPILKQYKSLRKAMLQDATLRSQMKADMETTYKNLGRWYSEAMLAANAIINGSSLDYTATGDDEDRKERWVLDILCDELLVKGRLPSVKEQNASISKYRHLNKATIALWSPLLLYVQSLHPKFFLVLSLRCLSYLSGYEEITDAQSTRQNSDQTLEASDRSLARWVLWLVATSENDKLEGHVDLRRELIAALLLALAPAHKEGLQKLSLLQELLQIVGSDHENVSDLCKFALSAQMPTLAQQWDDGALTSMDHRLQALLASEMISSSEVSMEESLPLPTGSHGLALGWTAVSVGSTWTPSPIGVYSVA